MTSTQIPAPHAHRRPDADPHEGPTEVIAPGRGGLPVGAAPQPWTPPTPPPAGPPPGYPAPQWGTPVPPWGPPPSSAHRKWAIVAGAVAAVATITAVTVAVTAVGGDDDAATATPPALITPVLTPAPPSPEPEPVEAAAPDPETVLLSAQEVRRIVGTFVEEQDTIARLVDSSAMLDDPSCVGVVGPIQRRAYSGADYDLVAGSIVGDPEGRQRSIIQGAVSFSSHAGAAAYVADAQRSWRECSNRSLTLSSSDGESHTVWNVESPAAGATGDFMTVYRSPEGSRGGCERALGSSGAIVVDTLVCGIGAEGEALGVAEAIADKATDG